MIPLKNANGKDQPSIDCENEQATVEDDTEPTYNLAPTGARIYFVQGDTFEILDRDATDGNGAKIQIPTAMILNEATAQEEAVITVDIYMRVLGKPLKCIDIRGLAYDATQNLYFWAGTVHLNRKRGKSSFISANELFNVQYCQVDELNGGCLEDTEVNVSVFNSVFQDYFWDILNDGTRLVQVRLYLRDN
jgi:hypothetical protein